MSMPNSDGFSDTDAMKSVNPVNAEHNARNRSIMVLNRGGIANERW